MSFVLYLTGAPATGKTTLASSLASESGALVLSYGALLTARLRTRLTGGQEELRALSAGVVRPSDVEALDLEVVALVEDARLSKRDVVVESHAVTAEAYGFRCVPYSPASLAALGLTHIACLTASPSRILERLRSHAAGRRSLTESDLQTHSQLQASLALTYSHSLGIPSGFINADRPREEILASLLEFTAA